ncbi:MAG: hypothetical protein Kow0077_24170 [Anaerolineae bacterium]
MTEPRYVEATGQDVETAIKNGLARLGVSSKDVIVEVLEESSRGLFGIGGRPARVRLTLLAPPSPPEKAETQPASAGAQASTQETPARKKRRRRPRRKSRPQPEAIAEPEEAISEPSPMNQALTPVSDDDEEARIARETLQELLSKMGVQATVEAAYAPAADEEESSPLVLQVTGKDLGMLIGRRGETLAALQYITRLIVSRELQRRVDLVVDVEHYKARREQRLHSLALRMAKQAVQRGRTVKLEPMPAYERRIIHLTLRDRTDVFTQSEGEGEYRKVTIVPVKNE